MKAVIIRPPFCCTFSGWTLSHNAKKSNLIINSGSCNFNNHIYSIWVEEKNQPKEKNVHVILLFISNLFWLDIQVEVMISGNRQLLTKYEFNFDLYSSQYSCSGHTCIYCLSSELFKVSNIKIRLEKKTEHHQNKRNREANLWKGIIRLIVPIIWIHTF